ncbi:MAG: hypothetical protein ACE1ZJ_01240 [Nitrospirales bacterium]
MSAQAAEFVRDWRKANCRAWLMKLERILNRVLKKHALSMAEGSASFVLAALGGSTSEQGNRARRGGPSPPRLLRARWTAFLTILRAVLVPSLIS